MTDTPVDLAPAPGDGFIELRDGVPYIGTELLHGPGGKDPHATGLISDDEEPPAVDVTNLLTIEITADWHYNPAEPRDPHTGKWIRDAAGHYLDEAAKALETGAKIRHQGGGIEHTRKGYRVWLPNSGSGGHWDNKVYEHPADAAEALRRNKHLQDGELKHGASHLPGAGDSKPPDAHKLLFDNLSHSLGPTDLTAQQLRDVGKTLPLSKLTDAELKGVSRQANARLYTDRHAGSIQALVNEEISRRNNAKPGVKPGVPEPAGGWVADGKRYHYANINGQDYTLHYAAGGGFDVHTGKGTTGPLIGHGKNAREAKALAEQHAGGKLPANVKLVDQIRRGAPDTNGPLGTWFRSQAFTPTIAAAGKIYGNTSQRWNSTTFIKANTHWAGVLEWKGRMGLDPNAAREAASLLDPKQKEVLGTAGIVTYWHEVNHSIGSHAGQHHDEPFTYMTPHGHDAEEGMTELGAWLTMESWLKALGVHDKPLAPAAVNPTYSAHVRDAGWVMRRAMSRANMLAGAQSSDAVDKIKYTSLSRRLRLMSDPMLHSHAPADLTELNKIIGELSNTWQMEKYGSQLFDAARRMKTSTPAATMTVGEWFAKTVTPELLMGQVKGGPWVAYKDLVQRSYTWLDSIAQLEHDTAHPGKKMPGIHERFSTVRHLGTEVSGKGTDGKFPMMTEQLFRAAGITNPSAKQIRAALPAIQNMFAADRVQYGDITQLARELRGIK